jgi:hypothetical protein
MSQMKSQNKTAPMKRCIFSSWQVMSRYQASPGNRAVAPNQNYAAVKSNSSITNSSNNWLAASVYEKDVILKKRNKLRSTIKNRVKMTYLLSHSRREGWFKTPKKKMPRKQFRQKLEREEEVEERPKWQTLSWPTLRMKAEGHYQEEGNLQVGVEQPYKLRR